MLNRDHRISTPGLWSTKSIQGASFTALLSSYISGVHAIQRLTYITATTPHSRSFAEDHVADFTFNPPRTPLNPDFRWLRIGVFHRCLYKSTRQCLWKDKIHRPKDIDYASDTELRSISEKPMSGKNSNRFFKNTAWKQRLVHSTGRKQAIDPCALSG